MADEPSDTLDLLVSRPGEVPTLDDVAAAARVSPATVSRVINNRPVVAAETRQRVLEAIALLNFRPSVLGRNLATRRTGTLGLLIGDITNPFYPQIVRAVQHAAAAQGMSVLLYETAEESEREAYVLHLLGDQHVDGVIICASRLVDERVAALACGATPLVLINRHPVAGILGTIDVDQEAGVRDAVRHLVTLGHRRIAYVGGPQTSQVQHRRLAAFRATCARHGIAIPESYVVTTDPTPGGGKEAARLLIRGGHAAGQSASMRPSAILAYNDLIAIGVIAAAYEAGLAVPEHLSIVGYDDIALAAIVHPPITTVRQPMPELGERAVRMLHTYLQQPTKRPADPLVIRLAPSLIVRGSTGPPRP